MNEWEAQLRLVEPRKYSNGTNCETTGRGHRLLRCTTWRPPRRVGTLPQTGGQNLRGLHILVERYRRRPRLGALGALGDRGSCFGTHFVAPCDLPIDGPIESLARTACRRPWQRRCTHP
ncbi:hypothetical protein XAC3607_2920048 [Xanthomonas citri pv. citri]|nr:hypothetical protein XAC902_1040118 [Xanthomonas citri pv. citri]CEH41840.1 hypothetical protein XAC3615_10790003 [Xanthomonas citri pv. citri]CEH84953.1 hypothetical protein XAC3607_2920048 [Xanthomonas citri pv. citri]CEL48491.1 hypothetical protein XACJM35_2110120 [Xanthomonas citri pv. citri]